MEKYLKQQQELQKKIERITAPFKESKFEWFIRQEAELSKKIMKTSKQYNNDADAIETFNNQQLLNLLNNIDLEDPYHASHKYKIIKNEIELFQKNLTDDQDVYVQLVSFGNSILIAVESIGYYNPDILIFNGLDGEANKVQLIQHVNQLNFLLIAKKRTSLEQPPRRIGFMNQEKTEELNNA